MKMLAVLAPCGTIVLYTGSVVIGKVHVGGILSTMINLGNSFVSTFPRRSSLLPTSHTDEIFEDELHLLSPVHPLQAQTSTRYIRFKYIFYLSKYNITYKIITLFKIDVK